MRSRVPQRRVCTRTRFLCFLICSALLVPFVSLALPEFAKAQVPNVPSPPRLGGSVPGPNLPNLDIIRQTVQVQPPSILPILPSIPPPKSDYCPDCCDTCPPGGNDPPEANAGGPYHGTTGSAVQFTGSGSWDPDGTIVSYQWNFGDGATGSGVSPTHSYLAALTYTVTLTVVDNNGATASAQTQATISDPQPPQQTNAAVFVSQSVPTGMLAGQNYSVSVTMKNTGTKTWTAANLHRLGSQNPPDNPTWGMSRVAVPSSIAPNQNATFIFTVTAPATAGTYNFQWRMVQDNVEWFGDFTPNIEVNVAPPPPPNGEAPNLAMARLDPANRTGESGDDLFSRNFNWSTSVVGLAGRAGLDLDLSLAYNSLVWTKWRTTINYNLDNGSPSPGFRLGFPVIQGRFRDETAVADAYLLITSSGKKVELRQINQSNVFQSTDSSYLRLEISDHPVLKTADGTQLSYLYLNNEYKCTEVKDRNGNFISVNYDNAGNILTVTDTLGRVITFNYENNLLHTITQTWTVNAQPQVHTWASFEYVNLPFQTDFPGLIVNGPQNGQSIPVLWKVKFADGSMKQFIYNPYGQMATIWQVAADGHRLNVLMRFMTSDYDPPQSDCPRITGNGFWVEDWIRPNWRNETHYSADAATGAQVATMEDQTVSKEYYVSSGRQKGLLVRTENYAAYESSPRKWTTTAWTQDNPLVNYQANPRPTETNIYDSDGNHRRSTIAYTQSGLPSDFSEFAADGTTVLRRSHTDYNGDQGYLNRHILGLPSVQLLYGRDEATGTEQLLSKVDYQYDANGQYDLVAQSAPVQHDEINYGIGLVYGRGNLTSTRRFDVNFPNDESKALPQSVGYNTTGLPYFSRDPLGHQVTLRYEDWFSDNMQHNAMAYPTRVTDADGFNSLTQYSFDLGAVTRSEGPPPQGFSQGAIQTTEYDPAGRVAKVRNEVNGAYTRFAYPDSGKVLNTFTTIRSTSEESYSVKVFDGAGRVRAVAGDLPGSTEASAGQVRAVAGDLPGIGRYWGQYFIYDIMGRVGSQSNPTETSATGPTWVATGDDDPQQGGNGWVYTQQTYDWKGRPTITTNQDGTTKEASYGGCGCAGGAVVTLTDEGTLVDGVAKKRQQKIYSDSLGRTIKIEVLNWDGEGPFGSGVRSVYSTTVNSYNARDQVTSVKHYQGTEASGVYHEASMTFDGYGRIKTKHVPEQNTGSATTWDYNLDDTIQRVTDARGYSSTFSYNARHLVTSIAYAPGTTPLGSSVARPGPVNYDYDAAGNRLWMTDAFGRTDYSYDQLSRMKDETRTFSVPANGIAYYQPAFNNSFKLAYQYTLSGQLASITDSSITTTNYHGSTVSYEYDPAGRLQNVNGSGFANVAQYASNMKYRAWGAISSLTYGNGLTFEKKYDSRLRISQYTIGGRTPNQDNGNAPPTVMKSDFNYYDDGRIRYSHDNVDAKFDTGATYDRAGRLVDAYSGSEANDFFHGTNSGPATGAYRQTYAHDAWNNLTNRDGNYWGHADTYVAGYDNSNRRGGSSYDAEGNVTADQTREYLIDAAGHVIDQKDQNESEMTQIYDGDGQRIGIYQAWWSRPSYYAHRVKYSLRSTVLGGKVISEIMPDGLEYAGYVYAGGEVIAQQEPGGYAPVDWLHHNPVTGSYQTTDQNQWSRPQANFDPQGIDAGVAPPQPNGAVLIDPDEKGFWTLASLFPQHHCYLDGLEVPGCAMLGEMLKNGAAEIDPKFAPPSPASGFGSYQWADAWEDYDDGSKPYQKSDGSWVVPALRYRSVGQIMWLPGAAPLIANLPQKPTDPKINHAFGDAATAITPIKGKKNPCLDFFTQGRTLAEVSKIFSNFWKSATHDPQWGGNAGTRNAGGDPMAATVRVGSAFLADDDRTPGTGLSLSAVNNMYLTTLTNLTPRQNRAATILHEFAHALGKIPSDRENPEQSARNDAIIFEKCGTILDALPLKD